MAKSGRAMRAAAAAFVSAHAPAAHRAATDPERCGVSLAEGLGFKSGMLVCSRTQVGFGLQGSTRRDLPTTRAFKEVNPCTCHLVLWLEPYFVDLCNQRQEISEVYHATSVAAFMRPSPAALPSVCGSDCDSSAS